MGPNVGQRYTWPIKSLSLAVTFPQFILKRAMVFQVLPGLFAAIVFDFLHFDKMELFQDGQQSSELSH